MRTDSGQRLAAIREIRPAGPLQRPSGSSFLLVAGLFITMLTALIAALAWLQGGRVPAQLTFAVGGGFALLSAAMGCTGLLLRFLTSGRTLREKRHRARKHLRRLLAMGFLLAGGGGLLWFDHYSVVVHDPLVAEDARNLLADHLRALAGGELVDRYGRFEELVAAGIERTRRPFHGEQHMVVQAIARFERGELEAKIMVAGPAPEEEPPVGIVSVRHRQLDPTSTPTLDVVVRHPAFGRY